MLARSEGHKLRQFQKGLIHHSKLEIHCVSTQSCQWCLTGKKSGEETSVQSLSDRFTHCHHVPVSEGEHYCGVEDALHVESMGKVRRL